MGTDIKKFVIGIDPDTKGAIAIYQNKYLVTVKQSVDLADALIGILEKLKQANEIDNTFVVVEQPPTIPGMNIKAVHTQLTSYGIVLGILRAYNVSRLPVVPRVWQAKVLPSVPKKKLDENAYKYKKRFKEYVSSTVKGREPKAKIENSAQADAVAIAMYGLMYNE